MPDKIFAGKTDTGLKRQNNEDAFVVSPELDFCLAADGMGGAAAGEVASEIFAKTALEVFSGSLSTLLRRFHTVAFPLRVAALLLLNPSRK